MEPTPDSVLNLAYLNRLMETTFAGLGKESFAELIDIYQQESQDMIRNAIECLHQSSILEAQKYIHSLKGSSANMGALLISNACKRIEDKIESGDTPIDIILDDLGKMFSRLELTIAELKLYHQSH